MLSDCNWSSLKERRRSTSSFLSLISCSGSPPVSWARRSRRRGQGAPGRAPVSAAVGPCPRRRSAHAVLGGEEGVGGSGWLGSSGLLLLQGRGLGWRTGPIGQLPATLLLPAHAGQPTKNERRRPSRHPDRHPASGAGRQRRRTRRKPGSSHTCVGIRPALTGRQHRHPQNPSRCRRRNPHAERIFVQATAHVCQ